MTRSPSPADSLLARASVPRYTSYPPANHFTPEVGPDRHARWIASVDPDRPVSIYLHIPFCRRLCHFCACRTQGTRTDAPLDAYVKRLVTEIRRVAALLRHPQPASAVHFGGGTPTILPPHLLRAIDAALRSSFDVLPDAEVSVEVDPMELDERRLDALASIGLTRASIGVQDFADAVQSAIGRPQSFEATRAAAEGLRARGARSLNVDLIYGLPHQDAASLRATLAHVDELVPDRVAIYGYAHVPQMARRQRLIPQDALPGPAERLALFELARRLLLWAGYVPAGIDHFARPGDTLALAAQAGRLRRNFQGYTTDDARVLLGFGASAISRFPQGHVQNAPASGAWAARIDEGRLASVRGYALSSEDRCRGEIIDRLMCDFAADVGGIAAAHGMTLAAFHATLERILERFGPEVAVEAGHLRLTASDGRFARLVCAEFDTFLAQKEAAYSRAI
ncbi:oxygen-independent coproporphyrinogen III oxidase [Roseivivax isoporae]